MHLAKAGLEPGTPDSLSQASSHFITAVTSAGSDLGLVAAPELFKAEELLSYPLDCWRGGAGWVFIVSPAITPKVGGAAYVPTQQLHEF